MYRNSIRKSQTPRQTDIQTAKTPKRDTPPPCTEIASESHRHLDRQTYRQPKHRREIRMYRNSISAVTDNVLTWFVWKRHVGA